MLLGLFSIVRFFSLLLPPQPVFFFFVFFCRVPMLLGLFSIVRFFSLLLPPQPGQCYLRPEKQPQEKAKL